MVGQCGTYIIAVVFIMKMADNCVISYNASYIRIISSVRYLHRWSLNEWKYIKKYFVRLCNNIRNKIKIEITLNSKVLLLSEMIIVLV